MFSFQNAWPMKTKAVYTLLLFHNKENDKENTARGSKNIEAVRDIVCIISGIGHCRVNDFSVCYC